MPSIPPLPDHYSCFEVAHRVPGRLRLRVPELGRQPALAPRIESVLLSLDAVQQVRCNPACASVVLYHRGHQAPPRSEMMRALATVVPPRARVVALVPVAPERAAPGIGQAGAPQRRDCLLCRLELALVRLVVKDLWYCWRQEQGLLDRPGGRRGRPKAPAPDPWEFERHGMAWLHQSREEREAPLQPNWVQRAWGTLRSSRSALTGLARPRLARLPSGVAADAERV